MMTDQKHYYYLHTNGDLIHKPACAVDSASDYFDSPFVRRVWRVYIGNRSNAWNLAIESLELGARLERVKELAEKWKLTREDLPEFMVRNPKPTAQQIAGLEKFIVQVLGLDYHKTLDEIAAMDNPPQPQTRLN